MANFGSFFHKEEASVVGIDIGSSAIKIVQIKKQNGQAILETYGELALGPYGNAVIGQAVNLPAEKIAEALVDLMNEKEVNVTTKKCGIAIPFASSLMTVIEMPQVSEKQLSVMVPLEARKYIPVPISEVMLDWSVVPKADAIYSDVPEGTNAPAAPKKDGLSTTSKLDVLVVAIHNDTISRYQDIAKKAALQPGFYEIEIFSSMRASEVDTLAPVMIMDMGAASTKLYIIERGVMRTSHTINRGSQDITQTISKSLGITPEQAEVMKREVGASGSDKTLTDIIGLTLDYIFEEANRTLLTYERKSSKTVSKVVLVGGGANLKGLINLAKVNFKTDTIAGDPFSKVVAPAFLENILKQTGPEFAVAIGVALRELAEAK